MIITLTVTVSNDNGSGHQRGYSFTDPKPEELARAIRHLIAQLPSSIAHATANILADNSESIDTHPTSRPRA